MKKLISISGLLLSGHLMAGVVSQYERFNQQLPVINHPSDDSQTQGITIVTVGDDVACDYRLGTTRIQDAIDDGFIHIRVADHTFVENVRIENTDMTIEGGYADCADAANDVLGGTYPVINGSGDPTDSVITITGNDPELDVILRRMTVNNGGAPALVVGGGISVLNSQANITLDDLTITANEANFGGGIGIFIGSPNIMIVDSLIAGNTSQSGGGISCNSADATINFFDTGNAAKGGIFNNSATTRSGGGVELLNGCGFTLYSGQDPDNILDFRGIISNTAAEHGGGVSVQNGSTFIAAGFQFLVGNNNAPATIRNNTADSNLDGTGNGGGVYVEGANSAAQLFNVNLQNNTAEDGGAVSAENGGTMNTESVNFLVPCWSPGSCNRFTGNTARSDGGVFHTNQSSDDGTSIEVFSSTIFGNTASGTGSVSFVDGASSSILIEGSMIYENNGGTTALYNFVDTSATYQFNTIADNDIALSVIRNFRGTVRLTSSIVHQTNADVVFSNNTPVSEVFDCLISHENDSFTSTATTLVDDPEFVDRANDDYHINAATSPALDFCDTVFTTPVKPNDIDNEVRGWDDPIASNFEGPYDIGADETYQNDIIFEDNFQ